MRFSSECRLPIDNSGGTYLELRVDLSWDGNSRTLRRALGPTTRLVVSPIGERVLYDEKTVIPVGTEGDAQLDSSLRSRFRELEAIRIAQDYRSVDLAIHVGPRVPWQHVVEFIHRAKRTGGWRILIGF